MKLKLKLFKDLKSDTYNKESQKKESEIRYYDLKEYLKEKGIKPLIIIMLIGVILISISSSSKIKDNKYSRYMSKRSDGEEGKESVEYSAKNNYSDDEIYKEELKKELVNMIKKVKGVEDTTVMLTFKSSSEEVILKDMPYSNEETKDEKAYSKEEETVIIEDDVGNSHPYVVKRIKPEVEGVVVGINSNINNIESEIMEVVQVLFDIPVHKIKIVKIN